MVSEKCSCAISVTPPSSPMWWVVISHPFYREEVKKLLKEGRLILKSACGARALKSMIYCSVAQSCPTLCDPTDCSTVGFPVLHHLPELAQTHVHWIGDIYRNISTYFIFNWALNDYAQERHSDKESLNLWVCCKRCWFVFKQSSSLMRNANSEEFHSSGEDLREGGLVGTCPLCQGQPGTFCCLSAAGSGAERVSLPLSGFRHLQYKMKTVVSYLLQR